MERAASLMQPLVHHASFFPTLLVDPDRDSSRTIKRLLEQQGVAVRVAPNAVKALEFAEHAHFRVIVVMANLADKDCLRFLESMHRATPRSWIIVANGTVDRALTILAYGHGADAVVEVPLDPRDVAERIRCFQSTSRPSY
jgi:DNA-binding response OmpR family regulator